MPWIKEFSREDYAPFAYLSSQIDLLYWRQGQSEEALTELKETGNQQEWVKTLHSMLEIQTSELAKLRKIPPLKSNHLQAISNINLDVAEYKLGRYQLFVENLSMYWEDWETGLFDRIRHELAFDHSTLSRLSNLVDYHDPDFRSPVLLYRLLDLFVLFLDQLAQPDETQEFISTFNDFNRSNTIEEAREKIDGLIEFTNRDIEEWVDLYLNRVNANFAISVLGEDSYDRGRDQLIGLTKEVYICLAEIYKDLKSLIGEFSKGFINGDPDSIDWEEFTKALETVAESFGKYPDRQLDRSIFIASFLIPTEGSR